MNREPFQFTIIRQLFFNITCHLSISLDEYWARRRKTEFSCFGLPYLMLILGGSLILWKFMVKLSLFLQTSSRFPHWKPLDTEERRRIIFLNKLKISGIFRVLQAPPFPKENNQSCPTIIIVQFQCDCY